MPSKGVEFRVKTQRQVTILHVLSAGGNLRSFVPQSVFPQATCTRRPNPIALGLLPETSEAMLQNACAASRIRPDLVHVYCECALGAATAHLNGESRE